MILIINLKLSHSSTYSHVITLMISRNGCMQFSRVKLISMLISQVFFNFFHLRFEAVNLGVTYLDILNAFFSVSNIQPWNIIIKSDVQHRYRRKLITFFFRFALNSNWKIKTCFYTKGTNSISSYSCKLRRNREVWLEKQFLIIVCGRKKKLSSIVSFLFSYFFLSLRTRILFFRIQQTYSQEKLLRRATKKQKKQRESTIALID